MDRQQKSRLKILHLLYESKGDYFGIGGVGERAYQIYTRLNKRHDITVLCKKYPGARNNMIEGIRHLFVGTESSRLATTLLSYAFRAAQFVRKHGGEYDVIIEEFSPAIPTFLDHYRKKPVILQIQGYTGRKYFEKYNPLFALVLYCFERFRPRGYRQIITVSPQTLEKYTLGATARVEVLSNGAPDDLFWCTPSEADYLLYLGRLDIHHKGLDILLTAFHSFSRGCPDIRLVIAGSGRDHDSLLQLIGKLPSDVQKKIELRGWVAGDEKTCLLRDALMVVMPSRYETQGIVALEAMASGKALVVSDIPELDYVPACDGGVSFRQGDTDSLAAAISQLASRRDLHAMGQQGRKWVTNFTWDAIALRFDVILQDTVAQHNRK
ncbi:MAG: glycosyltransferase family 4 protein [Thermodesulfovibrionales bacterium]